MKISISTEQNKRCVIQVVKIIVYQFD